MFAVDFVISQTKRPHTEEEYKGQCTEAERHDGEDSLDVTIGRDNTIPLVRRKSSNGFQVTGQGGIIIFTFINERKTVSYLLRLKETKITYQEYVQRIEWVTSW
jgi:hypothetical protein